MKPGDRTSTTLGTRILRGMAITSALLLGASYVWWAQDKANARATSRIDREILADAVRPPVISPEGAEPESKSDFVVLTPDVLISGSKSIQGVTFGQRLSDADLKKTLADLKSDSASPVFTPDMLISGSKAETVTHSVVNAPPDQQSTYTPDNLAFGSKNGAVAISIGERVPVPNSFKDPVPSYSPGDLAASSKSATLVSIGERVPVPTTSQSGQPDTSNTKAVPTKSDATVDQNIPKLLRRPSAQAATQEND